MKRITATILTVSIFLLYGLPSLVFCYFGAQLAIGSANPAYRAGFEEGSNGLSPDTILPIAIGLMCAFVYLIIVPILVGFLSFRRSKVKEQPETNILT